MIQLSEIAKAVNGQLLGADVEITSVASDSRKIVKNQLFVAIKGENFDGNTFALEAIKQGAAAVLVSDASAQVSPAVRVQDTRLALGQLAKHWRAKFSLPLVAVTGSNGKTTTKEMIAAILAAATGDASSILATAGNLNNDIGMPMTLLKIRENHQYTVIEMGMNHLLEIDYLTRLAAPDVAVITNAGTAHIGEVGSRDAIARAKGEIFAGLQADGIAVINADDDFANYWQSLNSGRKIITFGLNKTADVSASYEAQGNLTHVKLTMPSGETAFNLDALGEHNVRNALAASAVALALGISNAHIASGLASFSAVKGRLNWLPGFNDAVLIDDTYNANPDSMMAAIDVLATLQGLKIFVMADMAELGVNAVQMHADIGLYAKHKGIAHLFTFGDLSQQASSAFGGDAQHFATLETLAISLKLLMQANVTVLVKGSRFMQMERLVNAIAIKNPTIKENVLEESA
jgi:UDP-N-acetylmuramoyl-tripeptide--D-alanyl-D-alanine ligase